MPNPAPDRPHVFIIGVAAISVTLAALSLRVVSVADAVAVKPVPTADVRAITGYLAPLPNPASLAGLRGGAMVGGRDPFEANSFAPVPRTAVTRADTAKPAPRDQQWIVTSILLEDTRRSAIVNNAWVTVGDPLGEGARLTAIERKHIVVTDAKGIRHVVSIQGGAQ